MASWLDGLEIVASCMDKGGESCWFIGQLSHLVHSFDSSYHILVVEPLRSMKFDDANEDAGGTDDRWMEGDEEDKEEEGRRGKRGRRGSSKHWTRLSYSLVEDAAGSSAGTVVSQRPQKRQKNRYSAMVLRSYQLDDELLVPGALWMG